MELWHESAGDGSALALVHAGVCDSRMWDPQWATLGGRRHLVRCDLAGFGRTPMPDGDVSWAADVAELLDGQELGPVALIGASLGGRLALEVTVARPDLVDRLVLVAPSLPDHEWSHQVREFGAAEDEALERGDLDAAVEANLRMWVDGPDRGPADVDPRLRSFVGEMQHRAFELQLARPDAEEAPLVADVGARLTEIGAPTLVVAGTEDVDDTALIAERLLAAIPDARLEWIEEAAHLPSLERPAEFDRLLLSFLG